MQQKCDIQLVSK